MGKKQQSKDEAPNPNSIVNREIFQRLNFLYQASTYLKGLEAPGPGSREQVNLIVNADANEQPRGLARKKGGKRRKATLGELGSSYVRCMRTIGNKSVVRIDPNVKRTLCKGCDTVLAPGTTATVRVKGSPAMGHKVAYTCLACHVSRSIPAPPVALAIASASLPTISSAPIAVSPQDTALTLPAPSSAQKPQPRAKMRKAPVSRLLPLFARLDAGHVVFRGNDMLVEAQE